MGTHLIPREVEGEGRILIIFTMKGFIGTIIGLVVGAVIGVIAFIIQLIAMVGAKDGE